MSTSTATRIGDAYMRAVGEGGIYQIYVFASIILHIIATGFRDGLKDKACEPPWLGHDHGAPVVGSFEAMQNAYANASELFVIPVEGYYESLQFSFMKRIGILAKVQMTPIESCLSLFFRKFLLFRFIWSPCSDLCGRKRMIAFSCISAATITLLGVFVDTTSAFSWMMTLSWAVAVAGMRVSIQLALETLSMSLRPLAFCLICNSVDIWIVSIVVKQFASWRAQTLLLAATYAAQAVVVVKFLVESPRWLIMKESYNEAAESINTINNANSGDLMFRVRGFQLRKKITGEFVQSKHAASPSVECELRQFYRWNKARFVYMLLLACTGMHYSIYVKFVSKQVVCHQLFYLIWFVSAVVRHKWYWVAKKKVVVATMLASGLAALIVLIKGPIDVLWLTFTVGYLGFVAMVEGELLLQETAPTSIRSIVYAVETVPMEIVFTILSLCIPEDVWSNGSTASYVFFGTVAFTSLSMAAIAAITVPMRAGQSLLTYAAECREADVDDTKSD